MAIGDLFRPKHKHSDLEVRVEAVNALGDGDDDAQVLAEIAREDEDAGVRRLALDRLRDLDLLSSIASSAADPATRNHARARAAEEFTAIVVSGVGDVEGALIWLGGVEGGQRTLAALASGGPSADVRRRALDRLREPRALADVVRETRDPEIAAAALERIRAPEALRALAMDIESRDLGAAVVDRIEDESILSALASRAKSKAVRSRANKRLLSLRGEVAVISQDEPGEDPSPVESGESIDERDPIFESFSAASTQPLSDSDLVFDPEPELEPDHPPAPELDHQPHHDPELHHDHEHDHGHELEPEHKKSDKADLHEKNLAALEQLAADMERLAGNDDVKLKTAEKKLQQADSGYPKLLVLPSGQKRKAIDRFQEARRRLIIKIGELREQEEWKRWANVPKQEELIKRVAALVDTPDASGLALRLKEAQAAWKEVGPAPRDKAQDLWQRFKDQSDLVYERIKHRRSEQAIEHKDNLRLKVELCVRAEELAESTDWGPTAEAFKRLQAEWKTIGPIPRKQAEEVWQRFRGACDRFFERRRPFLEQAIGERQENIERKQALVERAEQLAAGGDDADWDAAVREIGEMRRDWKRIGQIPHREFETLTRRISDAADRIYTRRDEVKAAAATRRRDEVLVPCAEADALLDAGGEGLEEPKLAELVVRGRAALRELESAGAATADLRERVAAVVARAIEAHPTAFKGTDLDPDQSRKRKEKLVAKVEQLAARAAPAAAAPAAAPTSAADMAERLRAALADCALGGVLSKDKKPVGDQLAEARDAWRRLGPVPGPTGEELERRFTEACRRAGASS